MKKILVLYIVSIFIMAALFKYEIIQVSSLIGDNINEYQFDVITINSIFAGFLFTGLSIILGMSNTKSVQALIKANRIQKIYISLFVGICVNLLSIIFCIMIILSFSLIDTTFLIQAEIVMIVIGVEALVVSLVYLVNIIRSVNKNYIKLPKEVENAIKKAQKENQEEL